MYLLNIDSETNRVLSVWNVIDGMEYGDMPMVDAFPVGNVADYLYIDGEFVYDPLPKPEPEPEPEPGPTGKTVTADEMAAAIMEGVNEI